MPLPKTKDELIQQSQMNYQKLMDLVDSFSRKERDLEFPKGTLNRNIRDVLAHLYHWHLLFLDWYNVGMEGGKPDMPAKGYSWKNTKELNRMIRDHYQNYQLDNIIAALNESHAEVQKIIDRHSELELYEKKHYKWTGSSSLGTYLRGSTSSHYHWACNLIKRCKAAAGPR